MNKSTSNECQFIPFPLQLVQVDTPNEGKYLTITKENSLKNVLLDPPQIQKKNKITQVL